MARTYSWNGEVLLPRAYSVEVNVDSPVIVRAEFILLGDTSDPACMEQALARLARYMHSGEIVMVKAGNEPRCFYCGQLNETGALKCSGCGGTM